MKAALYAHTHELDLYRYSGRLRISHFTACVVSRNIYITYVYFQTKLYFNLVRIREESLTQILR